MHYEISIVANPSGFGEFQAQPINGEGWDSACDLLAGIANNTAEYSELGVDDLIEGAEDIRGRIHIEPPRVFAARFGDAIRYFGIAEL